MPGYTNTGSLRVNDCPDCAGITGIERCRRVSLTHKTGAVKTRRGRQQEKMYNFKFVIITHKHEAENNIAAMHGLIGRALL